MFYLLALTINSMTGWNMDQVILISGLLTMVYTLERRLRGGGVDGRRPGHRDLDRHLRLPRLSCCSCRRAGRRRCSRLALQTITYFAGEAPPSDFSQPTVWVLLIYGFFWYLQRYTTDQTLVQRYLARPSRTARPCAGVAMGALLSVPVWTLFMLIGTCTWTFYQLTGEKLPAYITKGDQVFPHFLSTHLPPGLSGLVMAALIGAAMCALSSDLNAFASVGVEDMYRHAAARIHGPPRGCRWRRSSCAAVGFCAIATALVLSHTQTGALSLWFSASAIVSGGLAGLFLLAFLSPRANRQGVYAGIAACFAFTAWATLTLGEKRIVDLGRFNFPWHDYMIGAIGNVVLLAVGFAASLRPRPARQGPGAAGDVRFRPAAILERWSSKKHSCAKSARPSSASK